MNLLNSTDREAICGKYNIDILLYSEHLVESAPISGQPIDLIRSMFEHNVFAMLEIAHYFIREFIARKAGKIIFTSSLGNLGGMPYFSAYCASKYALDIIALGLREELWPFGIHVSNIDVSVFKEIKHHIGDLLSYD